MVISVFRKWLKFLIFKMTKHWVMKNRKTKSLYDKVGSGCKERHSVANASAAKLSCTWSHLLILKDAYSSTSRGMYLCSLILERGLSRKPCFLEISLNDSEFINYSLYFLLNDLITLERKLFVFMFFKSMLYYLKFTLIILPILSLRKTIL